VTIFLGALTVNEKTLRNHEMQIIFGVRHHMRPPTLSVHRHSAQQDQRSPSLPLPSYSS
jgi:hypothetical protein